MKLSIQLSDLLQQNEAAIAATSTFIAQGMAEIDCSEVDMIEPQTIELLFSAIPQTWTLSELEQAFNFSTITTTLKNQLLQRIDHHTEQLEEPQTRKNEIATLNTLDIFKLRNEVIQDYRSYIESFLKIRNPRVKEFVDQALDRGQL